LALPPKNRIPLFHHETATARATSAANLHRLAVLDVMWRSCF
jgi:hypothetical protein